MLKKVLFPLAAILISGILLLLLLEIVFHILPVNEGLHQRAVNTSNPILRLEPNRNFIWSKGKGFSIVAHKHSNNYGFLNDQDYLPGDTTPMLAVIGDSYVEACQVMNRDAFHGILQDSVSNRGRVYSLAASGAALPTYLQYARYAVEKFGAQGLIITIIGNDFDESLLKYKSAPRFHYFTGDPAQNLEITRVDYEPSFIKKIARSSGLIRYLLFNAGVNSHSLRQLVIPSRKSNVDYVGNTAAQVSDERLLDSKLAVDVFLNLLPVYSGLDTNAIAFVVDGMRPQLYNSDELKSAVKSYFGKMRDHFITEARSRGYEIIDMQSAFLKAHKISGQRFEFADDNHWNRAGHKLTALQILKSALYKKIFYQLPKECLL